MNRIAIFYHCLIFRDHQFLLNAFDIIRGQMSLVEESGLMDAAESLHVGLNGGVESLPSAGMLFPPHARIQLHGLDSRNENSTILMMESWVKENDDAYVLYFHSKGATKPPSHEITKNWRSCMMRNLVQNWETCIKDLSDGCDMVGCHWMTGDKTPPGQSIFAGNFWWAKSSFLKTLPSILERARIKKSGLKSVDSRYESEVWIGNGPRLPVVKDYHPEWISNCKP